MTDMSKKRSGRGYLIAAAVFFAAGAALAVYATRLDAQVRARLDTNTLELTADLSKAGEYKGRFVGVEHFSHGFGMFIDFDEPIASKAELAALTDGIEGEWISSDSILNQPFECSDTETYMPYPKKRFGLLQFSIARPADGDEVTLAITKPSAAMAGKGYKIVSNYIPCGLEFASVSLCALSALVLWVVAAVFLIVWAIVKYRLRKATRKLTEL